MLVKCRPDYKIVLFNQNAVNCACILNTCGSSNTMLFKGTVQQNLMSQNWYRYRYQLIGRYCPSAGALGVGFCTTPLAPSTYRMYDNKGITTSGSLHFPNFHDTLSACPKGASLCALTGTIFCGFPNWRCDT